ncbi:hypothetical protein [Cellulomonas sp. URHE0023]|uniref:hypothetical protein n=1 Tax=Cellulomonas sp. URHE0023 TaxID=1380354 RepID=UPI00048A3557|nr:hypothetical protein [Cellulomonas sp. URHE0023]
MPTPLPRLSATFLAAVCAGAVAGVVARVLMRLLAYAFQEETGFTWEASTAIVLLFVVLMLPAALTGALAVGRRRWSAVARWAGVLLSCLVLITMAAGTATDEGLETLGRMPTGRAAVVVVLLVAFLATIVGGAFAASRLGSRWSSRFAYSTPPGLTSHSASR